MFTPIRTRKTALPKPEHGIKQSVAVVWSGGEGQAGAEWSSESGVERVKWEAAMVTVMSTVSSKIGR